MGAVVVPYRPETDQADHNQDLVGSYRLIS